MSKTIVTLALAAAALSAGGCNKHTDWEPTRRSTMNTWAVNTYFEDQQAAGVISQATLYPHHFEPNGAKLNELGEHDLAILADHYRANPGRLNVRQNGAPNELHDARIKTVLDTLKTFGVDPARVAIADAAPGGSGMASEFVVIIIDQKMDKPFTEDDDGVFNVGDN